MDTQTNPGVSIISERYQSETIIHAYVEEAVEYIFFRVLDRQVSLCNRHF